MELKVNFWEIVMIRIFMKKITNYTYDEDAEMRCSQSSSIRQKILQALFFLFVFAGICDTSTSIKWREGITNWT